MAKTYSVAEARAELPRLLDEVEKGRTVEISRRGKPIAVVLSVREHQRMIERRPTFRELYDAWRRTADPEELDVGPEYFDGLRDKSPGRRVAI